MKALKLTVSVYVENENPFFPFTTKIAPALDDAVREVLLDFDLRELPIGRRGPFPVQTVELVDVPAYESPTTP